MDIPASVAGIVEDETSVVFKILGIPRLSEPSEQERNAAAISSETRVDSEYITVLSVFKHDTELAVNLIKISNLMIFETVAFEILETSHTVFNRKIFETDLQKYAVFYYISL